MELQEFSSEFGNIRTVEENGQIWFIAKDIADSLGYSDTQAMTRRLDSDETDTYTVSTSGQGRSMVIVTESGLYASILGSQKPTAKKFKKWVTSEVLPAIRKTGSYSTGEAIALATKLLREAQVASYSPEKNKNRILRTIQLSDSTGISLKELYEELDDIHETEFVDALRELTRKKKIHSDAGNDRSGEANILYFPGEPLSLLQKM